MLDRITETGPQVFYSLSCQFLEQLLISPVTEEQVPSHYLHPYQSAISTELVEPGGRTRFPYGMSSLFDL